MKPLFSVVLTTFAFSACLSPSAFAADITFSAATTLTGENDVLNAGELAYGYNWSNANVTANGVTFTGTNVTTGSPTGGGVSLTSSGPLTFTANSFVTGAAPYAAFSTAYKDLLKGASYRDFTGSTITVQLNNLKTGHLYAVQTWGNDARGAGVGRSATINGGANTVTLDYNTGDVDGSPGQYTIGRFTADAATDTFTLTSNNVGIEAVQVRDITGAWSGAASATWNATDVNFAGGSYNTITSLATPVTTVGFADTDGLGNAVTNKTISVVTGGISVGSMEFQNTTAGGAYILNGPGALTVSGDIIKYNTGAATISGPVVFSSGATHALEVRTGSTDLAIGGVISGSNLTLNLKGSGVSGDGNVTLSGTNTYTGTTNIVSGRIDVINSSAFGTSAVNVANGGEIFFSGGTNYANNFTLNGGFGFATNPGDRVSLRLAGNTISGSITLATGTDSSIATNANSGTLSGKITGAGALTIGSTVNTNGSTGRIVLTNATNDWSGGLSITRNNSANTFATTIAQLGASNVITNSNSVTFQNGAYSVLDLNGFNETVDLLSSAATGDGKIINSSGTASVLTIGGGNATTATFSGSISNTGTITTTSTAITETGSGGGISLVKIGASTQILTGSSNYTGSTTVTGGVLALGASNALTGGGAINLNGGTLDGRSFSNSLGLLALQASSTLHVDAGGVLAFADSSEISWDTASLIEITGAFVAGNGTGIGSLRFGTDQTGLTAEQLAKFSSAGYTNFQLDSLGYLTAVVPEPSSSILVATGLLGFAVRRRRA